MVRESESCNRPTRHRSRAAAASRRWTKGRVPKIVDNLLTAFYNSGGSLTLRCPLRAIAAGGEAGPVAQSTEQEIALSSRGELTVD